MNGMAINSRFRRFGFMLPGAAIFILFAAGISLAVENGNYPNGHYLVTTQWLADNLDNPNVRILDRQDIEPEDNAYAQGHIPNAIRMPTSAIKGIKFGIPEMMIPKDLVEFLQNSGISADHHIIIAGPTDRLPASTRAFWALDVLGHKKVSILDGGFDKWEAERRPVTTEAPKFDKTTYKVDLKRNYQVTGEEIAGYLGFFRELNVVMVDSRRPDEFKGEKMSRESEKLGRIPGAINIVFPKILIGEKYKEFKSASDIRTVLDSAGITHQTNAFFSCVSGCFGTVMYFGARLLDYPNVAVYDGGWIEWSRRPYPVETPEAIVAPAQDVKKEKPAVGPPKQPHRGC